MLSLISNGPFHLRLTRNTLLSFFYIPTSSPIPSSLFGIVSFYGWGTYHSLKFIITSDWVGAGDDAKNAVTAYVFENSQRDWKSKIIIDLRASLSIGRSPCLCLSHVSLQMKRGNFHFPSFLQSHRKVGHLFRQAKILPASLCVSLSVCISLFSIPAISSLVVLIHCISLYLNLPTSPPSVLPIHVCAATLVPS